MISIVPWYVPVCVLLALTQKLVLGLMVWNACATIEDYQYYATNTAQVKKPMSIQHEYSVNAQLTLSWASIEY